MRVYTVEDLKTFKRSDGGWLICPSGDYSQIKSFDGKCSFDDVCSFGKYCSFLEECSFGKRCTFGDDCNLDNNHRFENIKERAVRVLKIDGIGDRKNCIYFYKTSSRIYVRCGCFFGDIEEFENEVNDKHAAYEIYRKEYLEAIKFIKLVI